MTENEKTSQISEMTERLFEQTGDVSHALKLLGFLVFVANEGIEPFQTGEYISVQTYHRWVEQIRRAGLGDILLDIRLRQLLVEFFDTRFGDLEAASAKDKILEAVDQSLERLKL